MDLRRLARWALPALVSAGTLAYLLARIDLREALRHVDLPVVRLLVPALLLYGALSLWIEALSLTRATGAMRRALSHWTCARIKAASYPLSLVHYGLGAGALTYLLRRHGGLPLASAAGVVMLIAFLDLGLLLGMTAVGAGVLATRAPALEAGVVIGMFALILGGLTLLRAPISLGPLDRLRELDLFRAAREAPLALLLQLGLLRGLFVLVFIALGAAGLAAFGVSVPPGDLVVGVAGVALVAALPIAVAGLGTGQVAFVYLLRHWGEPDVLLACSLALSAGLIVMRASLGLLFAREFTREAMEHVRDFEA